MPRWRPTGCLLVLPVVVAALLCSSGVSSAAAALLFTRPRTEGCVPADELGRPPAAALRSLTEEEVAAFARDGSVKLRGMLDDVWLRRLRKLVQDCFEHPNVTRRQRS